LHNFLTFPDTEYICEISNALNSTSICQSIWCGKLFTILQVILKPLI